MNFLARTFVAYCRTVNHPAKLRLLAWIGRFCLPADGFVVDLPHGFRMRLQLLDHLERCLLMRGHYEDLTSRFLLANIRPGMLAVVAGANLGYYPLLLAHGLRGGGTVLGVEPFPGNLRRCLRNLELNPSLRAQIQIAAVALGRSAALRRISAPPEEHAGLANLRDAKSDGVWVQLLPLSSLLAELNLPAPELMLLDVEGWEQEVLAGFATAKPAVLVIENAPGHQIAAGNSETELFASLSNLGYRLAHLDGRDARPGDFFPEQTLVAHQPDRTPVWLQSPQ